MKIHLSLPTDQLEHSVAFYRTLFDAEPFKQRDDYALFIIDEPSIELALDAVDAVDRAAGQDGTHYGVAVADPQTVEIARRRLQEAGLKTDVERDVTCCYARQTKVWATDPNGRRWEIYHVDAETDERDDAGCCAGAAECCGV
jgi:catechol 2,3-dioxygenase-like lactoylglutathione lyase family enzyme